VKLSGTLDHNVVTKDAISPVKHNGLIAVVGAEQSPGNSGIGVGVTTDPNGYFDAGSKGVTVYECIERYAE